jgi:hypothetical protein
LTRFDERAIHPGEPLALLNRRFAPVYLHHRFTIGAAVKAVGGMEYRYAVRGDALPATRIIAAARQRRALDLLLDAIQPAELAIPEPLLQLMAPTPFGYDRDERSFRSPAAPAFDQIAAARTLATQVVRGLLTPQRAARLVAFADRDSKLPTLTEVIGRIVDRTWGAPAPANHAALQRAVQRVVVDELIRLASEGDATTESRAGAEWGMRRIQRLALSQRQASTEVQAHRALVAGDIDRFLGRRDAATPRVTAPPAPPGTPIGERP